MRPLRTLLILSAVFSLEHKMQFYEIPGKYCRQIIAETAALQAEAA
jgi:hypothetical protein